MVKQAERLCDICDILLKQLRNQEGISNPWWWKAVFEQETAQMRELIAKDRLKKEYVTPE